MPCFLSGRIRLCATALFLAWAPISPASDSKGETVAPPSVSTFSIVAFDPGTGDLGVAVASKFFGVGSVVPWAKAGVGAVATQARGNVAIGPAGINLLESGDSPGEVVKALIAADALRDHRQIGVVDAKGRAAAHTGSACFEWAGHLAKKNFSVQGNLLTGEDVIQVMVEAFVKAKGVEGSELADWLMTALKAGQAAGGDKRGRQSAALLVVRERGGLAGLNDRYIDLRVEDHSDPVVELDRLLAIHKEFFARAHRTVPAKSD